MAKKTNRNWVTLEYAFVKKDGTKGKERIYVTTKNKKNTQDKLTLKKFSKVERKHVQFVEAKGK